MRVSIILLLFARCVMAQGQENLQFDRLAFSIVEGAWEPTSWLVIDASGRMVEVLEKDRLNLTATDHTASTFLKRIDFDHPTRLLDADERSSLKAYTERVNYANWTQENQHHTWCDHTIFHIRVLTEDGHYHKHQLRSRLPSELIEGHSLNHVWVKHFLSKKIKDSYSK